MLRASVGSFSLVAADNWMLQPFVNHHHCHKHCYHHYHYYATTTTITATTSDNWMIPLFVNHSRLQLASPSTDPSYRYPELPQHRFHCGRVLTDPHLFRLFQNWQRVWNKADQRNIFFISFTPLNLTKKLSDWFNNLSAGGKSLRLASKKFVGQFRSRMFWPFSSPHLKWGTLPVKYLPLRQIFQQPPPFTPFTLFTAQIATAK